MSWPRGSKQGRCRSIVTRREIPTPFAHMLAVELRRAFDDKANRIAGGVAVDAAQNVWRVTRRSYFSFRRVAAAFSTMAITSARRAPVADNGGRTRSLPRPIPARRV